ncbi:hypothetical protein [Actinomycetospora termitidis]|uniref:Uncharacterized protein n=1 Tax=Actinomycetospora termitidis TaxID=3053470 RepID=A0ABT7M4D0_9PSEU|nr:hypothetical protein [Actinomycetospora sp. Odt1-22]MDL5155510.1 hypothetical protein [Actinomycetospora sp. Odt1-22]
MLVPLLAFGIPGTIGYLMGRQPDRPAAERLVAEQMSARYRAAITASCDDPDRSGWRCTLRDSAGNRGWWYRARFVDDCGARFCEPTREYDDHRFPVLDARGVQVETLPYPDPGSTRADTVDDAVFRGNQAREPDYRPYSVQCPDPVGTSPVPCRTSGVALEASARTNDTGGYELTVRWALAP